MTDDRAYELGIADVIAHLVGPSANVAHDVRLRGRTGSMRQVDIVVRGQAFDLPGEALIVVDCKLHARPVAVSYVDAFAGMVDDVGADLGLLVSASGFTTTGLARAGQIGMRVHALARDELAQWAPPGTRFIRLAIPADRKRDAWRALVRAGYRVGDPGFPPIEGTGQAGEAQVEAFRLADRADASSFTDGAIDALAVAGIEARMLANSIVMQGGTPAHMWIGIHFEGWASPISVMAADDAELTQAVERVAQTLGLPVAELDVRRPEGWPLTLALGVP